MKILRVEKRSPNFSFGVAKGLLGAALFMQPLVATAYVGPGAGLGVIGTIIALLSAVFLLIVGFVWYPIKRLLKRNKKGKEATDKNEAQQSTQDNENAEKQEDSKE